MGNPLFEEYGNGQRVESELVQFLNDLDQFEKSFRGDARSEVQKLLASGQMTQQQFNRLAQIAGRITQIRKR